MAPVARDDVEEVHYFIQVGESAPEFTATDDQGKKWLSSSYLGKKKVVVLCFYEGDFMPDCTREATEMRAVLSQLHFEKAEVFGISGDTPANHQLFKKTNKLKFTLLSDKDAKIAHRWGVSRLRWRRSAHQGTTRAMRSRFGVARRLVDGPTSSIARAGWRTRRWVWSRQGMRRKC